MSLPLSLLPRKADLRQWKQSGQGRRREYQGPIGPWQAFAFSISRFLPARILPVALDPFEVVHRVEALHHQILLFDILLERHSRQYPSNENQSEPAKQK